MIKKEYIQPKVKEIKVNLPVVLAADSINGSNGYKFGEENNVDDNGGEGYDGSDAI